MSIPGSINSQISKIVAEISDETDLNQKKSLLVASWAEFTSLVSQHPSSHTFPLGADPCLNHISIEFWLRNQGFDALGFTEHCHKVNVVSEHNTANQSRKVPPNKKKKKYTRYTAYPTDLTRTPIFFPMPTSKMDKGDWPQLNEELIDTSWGYTYFTGPKLCVFDEMVFLSMMHHLHNKNSSVFRKVEIVLRESIGDVLVEKVADTYSFDGSASDLLRPIYPNKSNYSATYYENLSYSLRRFHRSSFRYVPSKMNSSLNSYACYHMLSGLNWATSKTGKSVGVQFQIDPFIAERVQKRLVTSLDLELFASIKGQYADFARGMYRFLASHKDHKWSGRYESFCDAILIDEDLITSEKKKRIRGAIGRLKESGILCGKKSILSRGGHLTLVGR